MAGGPARRCWSGFAGGWPRGGGKSPHDYLKATPNLPRGEWLVRNLLLGREVCRGLGQAPHVEVADRRVSLLGQHCRRFSQERNRLGWADQDDVVQRHDKFRTARSTGGAWTATSVLGRRCRGSIVRWRPGEVAANVERLKQKDVLRDVPVFFGWGDGGGGGG